MIKVNRCDQCGGTARIEAWQAGTKWSAIIMCAHCINDQNWPSSGDTEQYAKLKAARRWNKAQQIANEVK